MGLAVNVLGLMLLVSPYPGDCTDIGRLNIEVVITGMDMQISWMINTTELNIYGFKAVVYNDEKETLHTSSVIQSQERETTISYELKGTSSVCIQALLNNTLVLQEACKEVTVTDLKLVIGILAGAIFLIPCVIVLAYIIYKDRKISMLENYKQLEVNSEHSVDPEQPSKSKKSVIQNSSAATGNVNVSYADETEQQSDSKKTVIEDPVSATGNVKVTYAEVTMQAKGVYKEAKEESITSENKDTKVPSLFKPSLSKDFAIDNETIESAQAENKESSSQPDTYTSRASKKSSLSKTTVSNDKRIFQQEPEIYVVRL